MTWVCSGGLLGGRGRPSPQPTLSRTCLLRVGSRLGPRPLHWTLGDVSPLLCLPGALGKSLGVVPTGLECLSVGRQWARAQSTDVRRDCASPWAWPFSVCGIPSLSLELARAGLLRVTRLAPTAQHTLPPAGAGK